MTRRLMRADEGFGLLLVVGVLAVMGALVLSVFGLARRELRNATDLGYALEAFESAESGLAMAEAAAPGLAGGARLVALPGPASLASGVRFESAVQRLNSSLLLVSAVGERLDAAGEVLARRRLGVVGRILPASDSTPARFEPLASRAWVQLYD